MTFRTATELDLSVMTHCEDSGIINRNMKVAKEQFGDDPDITHHWEIRSAEAYQASSLLAVELARKYKTQLHIAHISTAKELSLTNHSEDEGRITLEAVTAHIAFSSEDYLIRKALIKYNSSVKTVVDGDVIHQALTDGCITVVGTDHAPHLWAQKQGSCSRTALGMSMVQLSFVTMLELVDKGVLTIEQMVNLTLHAPAQLFRIDQRGFLRRGYKTDITIIAPNQPWIVNEDYIQNKCKWSPMMGRTYQWRVLHTFCNGSHLLNKEEFDNTIHGERVTFRNDN